MEHHWELQDWDGPNLTYQCEHCKRTGIVNASALPQGSSQWFFIEKILAEQVPECGAPTPVAKP